MARHAQGKSTRRSTSAGRVKARPPSLALPAGVFHRVPDNTDPQLAKIADRALERQLDVMEERVPPGLARAVLAASVELRDEICGPKPKAVNVKGELTLAEVVAAAAQEPEEPKN